MAQLWEVIGGAATGGILVREQVGTSSKQFAERLSTGALVEELKLEDDRLCYRLIIGTGPSTGWVSVKLKGKDLLVKTNKVSKAATREQDDPYELLGVSPDATDASIRSAFRKASLKVHPDRCPDDEDAARKFRALTQAKDLLFDPKQRLRYNLKHGLHKHDVPNEWWSDWISIFDEISPELEGSSLDGDPADVKEKVDLLIVGATGIVGTLACSLVRHEPGRTWAIAGRSAEKLTALESKFKADSNFRGATLIDSNDEVDVLVGVVQSARVVIDTRGPKWCLRDDLVEACINAGTHYIEISGEPKDQIAARQVIDTFEDMAREAGIALVFFCGCGALNDLGAWQMVKYIRTTFGSATRRLEHYEQPPGPAPGTYLKNWVERLPMKDVEKQHGAPFVYGGERSCGVRPEDKDDGQVRHDNICNMWVVRRKDGCDEWVIRWSCGLLDTIQPYGENFLVRDWGFGQDKRAMENLAIYEVWARANYDQYVADKKLPPPGHGPKERMRHDFVSTHVFVAEADDHGAEDGAEHSAYGILTAGPGGAGDFLESSALLALEAAWCLLDALDGKIEGGVVRAGCGTPAYHVAHLGILERLASKGISWSVASGTPPKELFLSILAPTLAVT